MKRTDKEQFVSDFRTRLTESSVLYLADFSGLDVKSITNLRSSLRESGAEFVVVKNRLAKLALADLDIPDLTEHLTGPTGFILSAENAAEPAKAVSDFAKEHKDRPVFKVGVLDAKLLDAAAIEKIAKLPSREQLEAELVGVFEAPMANLVRAMEGLTQEMAGLLEALKEKQET